MSAIGKVFDITQHYSATYEDQDIGAAEINRMHLARGFKGIGYHFVIRLDGSLELGRPEYEVGAHVLNNNAGRLGICVVGGCNRATGPDVGVDNRTPAQLETQIALIRRLQAKYRGAGVSGHRDHKATLCPGYDARSWWAQVNGKRNIPEPTPVAPNAPAYSWPFIKEGSTGSGVTQLQSALVVRGYPIATDGLFGPRTLAAVKQFQDSAGITVDGLVGPMTWAALLSHKS